MGSILRSAITRARSMRLGEPTGFITYSRVKSTWMDTILRAESVRERLVLRENNHSLTVVARKVRDCQQCPRWVRGSWLRNHGREIGRVVFTRFAFGIAIALVMGAFARADDVAGFGRSVEDAKLDARQHVLERLGELLRNHEPPLTRWQPSLADIEDFVSDPGRAGPSVHVEPLGLQHQWILPVRFPESAELARRDRQSRRREMSSLFLVAATVAAAAIWVITTTRKRSET